MTGDFEITGTEGFLALSKALKHAARGELRKEMNKRIKNAVKPVTEASRARALDVLPKRGGYAVLVARTPQRTQVRTGRDTAGVRLIVAQSKSSARRANRGVIRHPVFGNREAWVNQPLATPGWFDVPANSAKPEVAKAVQQAMQSIVDDIVRGGGG